MSGSAHLACSGTTTAGSNMHTPHLTISNLPTDVFSCIMQHLQEDAWQQDQPLDDVAALRSVCRSLRHAVDLTVTHARFHPHIRSMAFSCTGA
jgi:F-box domain